MQTENRDPKTFADILLVFLDILDKTLKKKTKKTCFTSLCKNFWFEFLLLHEHRQDENIL